MALSSNNLRGFTIVELLIVIVVIAILASISIVSYNGVQNRAKGTSAASAARSVATKAEMANTLKGGYPGAIADFNDNSESRIAGTGLKLIATASLNSDTGKDSVTYEKCTGTGAGAGGARVGSFNYDAGSGVNYLYLGNASGAAACSAWTAVTGS